MYVVPLPSERCTTTMSLVRQFRRLDSTSLNLRVVPLCDLAEEDPGDGVRIEL